MIPSCNTHCARVKFRLKKTQLETIFNNCPEGKLFRGNCPGSKNMGAIVLGGISWGKLSGGSCPGMNYSGVIVLGIDMGEIVQEAVIQGGNCH